jgi:hypothetical protein
VTTKQQKLWKVALVVTVLPFLTTCKKDKITGDFTQIIGKWRWVMTSGGISGQTTYPSTVDERDLEFLEKGNYRIYKSGQKSSKGQTLDKGDHLEFNTGGFENAQDALTYKKFYPDNIRNDSLFISDSKPPPMDGFTDIYVRQ